MVSFVMEMKRMSILQQVTLLIHQMKLMLVFLFFVQEMEQDEHNSTNNLSHFIEEIDVGDRFLFNRKIIIKIL